jgi:hypothetical protein
LKPGRLGGRFPVVGDRVADAGIGHFLDRGGHEADLARDQAHRCHQLGRDDADPVHRVAGAGAHHADLLALFQLAVDDAHQHDDAEIGVVPAVDQHGLQRRMAPPLGAAGG